MGTLNGEWAVNQIVEEPRPNFDDKRSKSIKNFL